MRFQVKDLRMRVRRGVCACVCVCVSGKSHLTSGASVRPENPVTLLSGQQRSKHLWDFLNRSVVEIQNSFV